jgi:YbbR domain-containing protein
MAWHPFRNLGLKFAALVLGVLVWLTVSGPQVERDIPRVPVVYRNLPTQLQITDQTETVDVHVRGVDSLVSRLQGGTDVRVEVDLAGQAAGTLVLPLRVEQVVAPMGVEVQRVDPGTVTLTLEKAGVIDLPVRPTIEGEPAAGYVIGDVAVDPASVAVIGPARRLLATSFAVTERVLIDGAAASVTQMVSAGVLDAELRLREPRLVRVTVRIEPAGERLVSGVRIAPRNLGPGLRFAAEPATVVVLVRGSSPALSRLDGLAVDAFVDVAGLRPGRHRLPVRVDLGGRLSAASVEPGLVTVTLRR